MLNPAQIARWREALQSDPGADRFEGYSIHSALGTAARN